MYKFCNECGNLMIPSNSYGKKVFICKCGSTEPLTVEVSELYVYKTQIKHPENENDLIILRSKSDDLIDGIKGFKCLHCGCKKGNFQYKHMRSYSKPTNLYIVCSNCKRIHRLKND